MRRDSMLANPPLVVSRRDAAAPGSSCLTDGFPAAPGPAASQPTHVALSWGVRRATATHFLGHWANSQACFNSQREPINETPCVFPRCISRGRVTRRGAYAAATAASAPQRRRSRTGERRGDQGLLDFLCHS